MFVPDNDLNQWRRYFSVLHASMKKAESELSEGRIEQARQLVSQTKAAAIRMGLKLEQAGAVKPGEDAEDGIQVMAEGVPLHLLNTPANKHYFHCLLAALNAATEVDKERYGESIGTDGCAQMIEVIMRETLGELYAPVGRLSE